MICPNCNTPNRDAAKYCDSCGFELPTVAAEAADMFGSPTARMSMDGDETADLSGIDQFAGEVPEWARGQFEDASYDPGSPDITMAFAGPYAQQGAQRIYNASTQAPIPIANAYALERRSRVRTIAIIALCAIALMIAVAGITYSAQVWGGKSVPDVIGMSLDDAKKTLEDDGFKVDVVQVKSDDAENIVLATEPDPGFRIDDGSVVRLDVSTPRFVPDISGLPLNEARQMLAAEGFTTIEEMEVRSDEPEGTVISVSPQAGTRSKGASKIILEVAVPYRVPDVSGMSLDAAKQLLESDGYSPKVEYIFDEEADEGSAVGTDPAAGTALTSGSEVTVKVAKHRSSELIALTRKYLEEHSKIKRGGVDFEISKVDDVAYQSGSTCKYKVTAGKYEYVWILDKTVYANPETLEGTITWTDGNEIASSDPPFTVN